MGAMHIHFEAIGGAAGDMIAAALLDAFPAALPAVVDAVAAASAGLARVRFSPWRDHVLSGARFEVIAARAQHEHRRLDEIERMLDGAGLDQAVASRARAIFRLLAEAEGRVHGVAPEAVSFHEVGALDSIGDVTAAAALAEHLKGASFGIGPLPLGSGRVASAHGTLPVPAPAVVELLNGFAVHDDGIEGERVTPTGAAILRHLAPRAGPLPPGRLIGRGIGFGTRRLAGVSNVLRVLVLEQSAREAPWQREMAAHIAFEVDDQTPEDLALGLGRLRQVEGVLDVLQVPVAMKKGRLATQVQVLARPERREEVIAACFEETSTIGLRHALIERAVLPRQTVALSAEEDVRVKHVRRPLGRRSAKVESDDLATAGNRAARSAKRRRALAAALADDADAR
jgi:uncharacterized protein (TIGR00299 family) protein